MHSKNTSHYAEEGATPHTHRFTPEPPTKPDGYDEYMKGVEAIPRDGFTEVLASAGGFDHVAMAGYSGYRQSILTSGLKGNAAEVPLPKPGAEQVSGEFPKTPEKPAGFDEYMAGVEATPRDPATLVKYDDGGPDHVAMVGYEGYLKRPRNEPVAEATVPLATQAPEL